MVTDVHRVVAPAVAGSSPVAHPSFLFFPLPFPDLAPAWNLAALSRGTDLVATLLGAKC